MQNRTLHRFETSTNLAISAVYTGVSTRMSRPDVTVSTAGTEFETAFSKFIATVTTSHDSATLGFDIDGSLDGTNWVVIANATVTVATSPTQTLTTCSLMPFMRVRYTNGATATTSLMITTHWE